MMMGYVPKLGYYSNNGMILFYVNATATLSLYY